MNNNRPQNLSAALIALEKIRQNSGEDLDTVADTLKKINTTNKNTDNYFSEVLLIPPSNIVNWSFHDRPNNELGNIDELAEEFKTIGQQQPCIIRPLKDKSSNYEIIVGERRWLAAKKANIKLKAIVLPLSDNDAALIQIAENKNRKDLSDYAKGKSFSKLINSKIITQRELIEKLKISPQKISKLLSYEKIPLGVLQEIGDMSKVSATTAEKIKQLCNKGVQYVQAIKSLSNKIRRAELGHTRLEEEVYNIVNNNASINNKKFFSKNEELLFNVHSNKSKTNILLSHHVHEYAFKNKELFLIALDRFAAELESICNKIPPEG
jgi:ParB family chromosome partitioning protein